MPLDRLITRINPRRIFETYSGLPRDIYVLFVARVVNSMGSFVFPFLTLLLTKRLGLSPAEAGIVLLVSSVTFVPGSLIGGRLADRVGRKKVLVVASLSAAALFVPCAFLGNSPLVAVFIIGADFFSGMTNPAINALLVDRTHPDRRQAAFSLLYLGHNMGFAVGPILAGFLFNHAMPLLFLGDAATTIIAMALVIVFVQESKPDREEMERAGRINPHELPETGGLLGVLIRRPFLVAFMVLVMILNFVYSQVTFALPIQFTNVFADQGPVFYGIIMTTNAIVVTTLTTPIIALTRRIRPVHNLIIVGVLYTLGFGMVRFIHTLPLFIISTVIWTVGEVIGATNINVYVANHTPASHRGRMNSVVPILMGAGFALGPMLVGIFMEHNPAETVWTLEAALAVIGTAALFVLAITERRHRIAAKEINAAPAETEDG